MSANALLATLAALPAGAIVTLRGYATQDGRRGDYTLELVSYEALLVAALRSSHRLTGQIVAATYGVSPEIGRRALASFRRSIQGRLDRHRRARRVRSSVQGGQVFGRVIARSTPSRTRGRVVVSPTDRVVAALERAAGLHAYRGFFLARAAEVLVDGVELCDDCGIGMDLHNGGECLPSMPPAAFDPYAFGLAKVSAEEGEGSW